MDLRIKTSDYEMTPEVRTYLGDKIATIEKLLGRETETARLEVELGRAVGRAQQGDIWRAEFILVRGGDRLVADADGESVNAAIDVAKDEILQQLRKSKGKSFALAKRLGGQFKKLARWE